MDNKKNRWFYLIILALVWGSSFILMKKALIGFTPLQVGALRILIAALALLAIGYNTLKDINKTQWWYIFLSALLGTLFPAFLFAFAVEKIDSSVTSILNSLTPLYTLIVGALIYGFTFKKSQLFGVLVGMIGTVILIIKGNDLNPNQDYAYAILPIISSIGYAFNVNIIKKHLSALSPLTITTGNFVLIIIPTLGILIYSGFFTTFKLNTAGTSSLIYVSILAVFGTAYAKTLFNKLVHMTSPVFSASVTYLIPIVAVFWGMLDGEKLGFIQLIAGFIILFGVYLASKK